MESNMAPKNLENVFQDSVGTEKKCKIVFLGMTV